jgi:hypothetical protein
MRHLKKSPKGDVVIAFSNQYFREAGWRIGFSANEEPRTRKGELYYFW